MYLLILTTDDDIFYTPAKTPPKKKKQWMDDLLDDDKDLFGDIKADGKDSSDTAAAVVTLGKENKEGETKKAKSGGGLFDDLPLDDEDEPLSKNEGQASNVNGHKGKVAFTCNGWTCKCRHRWMFYLAGDYILTQCN